MRHDVHRFRALCLLSVHVLSYLVKIPFGGLITFRAKKNILVRKFLRTILVREFILQSVRAVYVTQRQIDGKIQLMRNEY